ncbi:putative E3 ubiquitin-protein ligase [Tetrabaena socialis]|uniref:HECT-type E3 ubiquitin transferase n=1 Tax=Tetrabaena socialis TaxID=47790 RepID=A0A2J8A019_9CHLO|nr:putative E3 ubiquitin-protein ligase [Tetrabaena socialis]|eukprot:PNH05877.1 putative E3 ubiquitin-protein ligase [Tetrabaena socialis]
MRGIMHASARASSSPQNASSTNPSASSSWSLARPDPVAYKRVVAALAEGLADALLFVDHGAAAELAERLRPISAACFNSRLGGETGGMDVAVWRSHTSATAFTSARELAALEAFWSVVAEVPAEEQRRLLQFWTGISHLPAGGFKHLSQQLQLVPARPGDDCHGSGAVETGEAAEAGPGPGSGADAEAGAAGAGGDGAAGLGPGASGSNGGSGGGGGGGAAAAPASGGGGGGCEGPVLLAAHTCFFQLRLPLLPDVARMREAVAESLANMGAFWNE